MKTYEKPRLIALTLSGNDLLCGCDFDVVEPDISEEIQIILDTFGWTLEECFAEDMTSCARKIEGYCKNTPESVVFAS